MNERAANHLDNVSPSMRAVEMIASARTGYDLFKVLKNYLPAFDLPFFAVFAVPQSGRNDLADRVVLTNWDSEAVQRCLGRDFYDWPFASGLRNTVLPSCIVLSDYLQAETDPAFREIAHFLQSAGHDTFLHVPTRSSRGWQGAISFSGSRGPPDVNQVMELKFVAQHAFERLMHILAKAGDRANPLTEREIQCQMAAARGLNSLETARELGITVHTVNYHLANAQKKLAARNKTHAVAESIRNGWLGAL